MLRIKALKIFTVFCVGTVGVGNTVFAQSSQEQAPQIEYVNFLDILPAALEIDEG